VSYKVDAEPGVLLGRDCDNPRYMHRSTLTTDHELEVPAMLLKRVDGSHRLYRRAIVTIDNAQREVDADY
jgi:hypothetical protein